MSVIPSVSDQEVSLKGFVCIKQSLWTDVIVDNHFSPLKLHYPLVESDPFSSTNLGILLLFFIPVKSSMSSCIHTCIMSIS